MMLTPMTVDDPSKNPPIVVLSNGAGDSEAQFDPIRERGGVFNGNFLSPLHFNAKLTRKSAGEYWLVHNDDGITEIFTAVEQDTFRLSAVVDKWGNKNTLTWAWDTIGRDNPYPTLLQHSTTHGDDEAIVIEVSDDRKNSIVDRWSGE